MKVLKWIFIVIAVVVVLALIFGNGEKALQPGASAPEDNAEHSVSAEEYMQVSAIDLAKAYEANEAAADHQYKNKLLEVSGKVDSVQKDFLDNTVVYLTGLNAFSTVHATIVESGVSKSFDLRKGQTVVVRCEGEGEVVGSPVLKDCTIQ